MDGLLILVLVVIISSCIVGVDSFRQSEYESKQKSATEKWEKAYHAFFNKTTNRSLEMTFEQPLGRIMYGSDNYPEIVKEIKETYKKWLNDEPYYIKYLGGSEKICCNSTYDHIYNVLEGVLMANRGYLTTSIANSGVQYNSVCPAGMCEYFARRLDEMLKAKGINEDMYVKPYLDDIKRLTYGGLPGYTGSIIWKPLDPGLYREI